MASFSDISPRVSNVLQRCALTFTGFLAIALSVSTLIFKVSIPQTSEELPVISTHGVLSFLVLLLAAGASTWLIFRLKNVSPHRLFLGVSTAYLLVSFILVYQYNGFPRADSGKTFAAMEALVTSDLTPFLDGGYIHRYPHQIGLMYYYLLGSTIFGGVRWIYYANIAWGLLSNFSIWQLVRLNQRSSTLAQVASIVLPALFLPHTLFNIYSYNHTPALALCLTGIVFFQKYFNEYRWQHIAGATVFFIAALLIRQNFQIIILAILIVLTLFALSSPTLKRGIAIVVIALTFLVPPLVQKATEQAIGVEIGKGIPAITWVVLGLQDSRTDDVHVDIYRKRLPGWFNGYSETLWEQTGHNTEATSQASQALIKELIHTRWNEPGHGSSFFATKIASSWLEPTYQSVFVAYLPGDGNFFSLTPLYSLYEGGRAHHLLTTALRGVAFLLFLGMGVHTFSEISDRKSQLSAATAISIAIFGGFLFHIFWETKSLYIYPYMMLSIPLTALAFTQVEPLIEKLTDSWRHRALSNQ